MSQSTALTVAQKARTGLNLSPKDMREAAEFLSKSGFFPDSLTLFQALTKIQAGQELGVPPFAALAGFHSINGKPTASARLMGALIKKSGEYDYDVVTNTADKAVIEIWRTKQPERRFQVEYTIQDAVTAGLTTGKNAETWKKYRPNMLFARCMSKAVVQHCPHLLYGANFYTPEEMDAKVDGDGDIQDAEFTATTQATITQEQYDTLQARIEATGAKVLTILDYYKVDDLKKLTPQDYESAMKFLNAKPVLSETVTNG